MASEKTQSLTKNQNSDQSIGNSTKNAENITTKPKQN